MDRHHRIRVLLVVAVAMIAGAVWLAGEAQRSASDQAAKELSASQDLLVAMLDQENGLRGFVQTRQDAFLVPFTQGRAAFGEALVRARAGADPGEDEEQEAIATQARAARSWQGLADGTIAATRAEGADREEAGAVRRKDLMERFRAANTGFRADLDEERRVKQRRANLLTVGLILGLSVAFALMGWLFIERGARADARRRRRQAHFVDVMQLARDEREAYGVVKRHLEAVLPDAAVVVLNSNNSADRLEAATALPDDPTLRDALRDAAPESCLAIRMGELHQREPSAERLLECELCGRVAADTTCVPSLVGGEVIGSVLIQHPRRLAAPETATVRATVTEAAPVIANLRNLALAEMRAATDLLTGLPNNRAAQETLKRMVAQAGRTVTPLAVALFDLDHFKQVNDSLGHGKGDEVLAAVGDVVSSAVRAGDFVARHGGEEFLVLLPGTDRAGALVLTEQLRAAVARIRVPGVERRITASFGVAVLPDDAGDAALLLRIADRALYKAKANGRDRVETIVPTAAAGEGPGSLAAADVAPATPVGSA